MGVWFFVFISLFSLFPSQGQAIISFEDAVFPELGVSGRALAMGNAFIGRVDDSTSAFYNPAGLGTVRLFHIHLSNFHMEANQGFYDLGISEDSFVPLPTGYAKTFSLDGIRELSLLKPGSSGYARMQAMPNLTIRYFTLGYLFSKRIRTNLGTEDDAPYEFASREDHGPYAGLNISLFGGVVKFGATGILLNRKELIDDVDAEATLEIEDDDYKKGSALILVPGFRLTLPVTLLPTFAATLHNPSEQVFTQGSDTGAPDPIKANLVVGFSLTPQVGKLVRIHLEANLKDAMGSYTDVSASRKLNLGGEIDIARRLFIRFGYGDGYGSGGLGLKTSRLEVDVTTYAVAKESSLSTTKTKDRRFSLTLSSGIGF